MMQYIAADCLMRPARPVYRRNFWATYGDGYDGYGVDEVGEWRESERGKLGGDAWSWNQD